MIKYIVYFFLVLTLSVACNNAKEPTTANALDAGRIFIRASLDGDFTAAENVLLNDEENVQLFDRYKMYYRNLPEDKKQNYKKSSYEINKYLDVSDSVTIINYSNSFMKKPMEIKLVKKEKKWMIDFKYTSAAQLPIDK